MSIGLTHNNSHVDYVQKLILLKSVQSVFSSYFSFAGRVSPSASVSATKPLVSGFFVMLNPSIIHMILQQI